MKKRSAVWNGVIGKVMAALMIMGGAPAAQAARYGSGSSYRSSSSISRRSSSRSSSTRSSASRSSGARSSRANFGGGKRMSESELEGSFSRSGVRGWGPGMSRGYGGPSANVGRWHYSSGDSFYPQYLVWYMILSDSGRHNEDPGTHVLANCEAAAHGVDLDSQVTQCEDAVREEHPVCQAEARTQAGGDAEKLGDGLKACDAATNEQIDACSFDARKVRYCLNNFGDPESLDDRTEGYLATVEGKDWRARADQATLARFERLITPLRVRLAGADGKPAAQQVMIAREVSASLHDLKERYDVPWFIDESDYERWRALEDKDGPEAVKVIHAACARRILGDVHETTGKAIHDLREKSDAIGRAHRGESISLEFSEMMRGLGGK